MRASEKLEGPCEFLGGRLGAISKSVEIISGNGSRSGRGRIQGQSLSPISLKAWIHVGVAELCGGELVLISGVIPHVALAQCLSWTKALGFMFGVYGLTGLSFETSALGLRAYDVGNIGRGRGRGHLRTKWISSENCKEGTARSVLAYVVPLVSRRHVPNREALRGKGQLSILIEGG